MSPEMFLRFGSPSSLNRLVFRCIRSRETPDETLSCPAKKASKSFVAPDSTDFNRQFVTIAND